MQKAAGYQERMGQPASYRPDIDGLRAVSILLVVGYHAPPWLLPGGFVGVDVFFVISGFLITQILLTQERAGRFSIADFYTRRVRRIFPALIAVLAVTYAIGWLILLPEQFQLLGQEYRRRCAGSLPIYFSSGKPDTSHLMLRRTRFYTLVASALKSSFTSSGRSRFRC